MPSFSIRWLLCACILTVCLPVPAVQAQDVAMADPADIVETPEVVVSATKTPVPVSHVTSAIEVIKGEDLERKRIKTVIDALRLAEGVFVSSSGGPGTEATVKMRGAYARHTLVLIDGVRVADQAVAGPGAAREVFRTMSAEAWSITA